MNRRSARRIPSLPAAPIAVGPQIPPGTWPRQSRPHVQGNELAIFEGLGHVPIDDALGQPFGDRRLAHPRLPNQQRDCSSSAERELESCGEFPHPGQSPGRAAPPRQLRQVAAILFQGLILAFGVLVGHFLIASNVLNDALSLFSSKPNSLNSKVWPKRSSLA
jgi:hypothetical protein